MNDKAVSYAYIVAITGGAVLWQATAAISGKIEAWDEPSYWIVTYPLSIILAGWLGYLFPKNPWQWGFSIMFAQAGMLMMSSSSFGLLPLGLIFFGVLALPASGFAQIMARLRLHNQKQ